MKNTSLFSILAAIILTLALFSCKSSTETSLPPDNTPDSIIVKQGISGTIRNVSTFSRIADVAIKLFDSTTGIFIKSTTSNVNGYYFFDSLQIGKYIITFEKKDYTTESWYAYVFAEELSKIDVKMWSQGTKPWVLFHVQDAKTKLPIKGAVISVDNVSGSTDDNGNQSVFADQDGTIAIDFLISAPGYLNARESLKFSSEIYDTISLQKVDDHLVCLYRFSNQLLDSSGNGHTGEGHGGSFVDDRFGKSNSALKLNGSSDYVSVADAPDLNFGKTSDFTICFWAKMVKLPSYPDQVFIVHKGQFLSNNFIGYCVFQDFQYLHNLIGTVKGEGEGVGSYPPDYSKWHFYCCSFSRSKGFNVYVDGQDDPTGFNNNFDASVGSSAPLLIGTNGLGGKFFNGIIDDMRIYNIALDLDAAKALYHENGW
jgi:hypothetical protein